MAIEQNIEFFCGEDIVLDDTIHENGEEQNIQGWAITFIVKDEAGVTKIEYTVGAGVITSTTPIARVVIPRAATVSLTPGVYDYELCRTDAGENAVATIGKLTLKRRVYGG